MCVLEVYDIQDNLVLRHYLTPGIKEHFSFEFTGFKLLDSLFAANRPISSILVSKSEWNASVFNVEYWDNSGDSYLYFINASKILTTQPQIPAEDHSNCDIVHNQVLGKEFKYCRNHKVEV